MDQAAGAIDANKLLGVVQAVAREARPHVEPHVTLDSPLEKELGLDSLARVELVLRLEKDFGASLPEQALATSETPRDLLRFLLSSAGHAPRAADTSVASLSHSTDVRPPLQAQTLPPVSAIVVSSRTPGHVQYGVRAGSSTGLGPRPSGGSAHGQIL